MPENSLEAAVPNDAAPNGYKELMTPLLIAGGVLLVLLAPWLGMILVQHNNGRSISWSPDEARDMAINLRCLGFLAFLGGCIERILLAIRVAAAERGKPAQSRQTGDTEDGSLLESKL